MSFFGSPFAKAIGAFLVAAIAVVVQWLATGHLNAGGELVTALTGVVSTAVVYFLRNTPLRPNNANATL